MSTTGLLPFFAFLVGLAAVAAVVVAAAVAAAAAVVEDDLESTTIPHQSWLDGLGDRM